MGNTTIGSLADDAVTTTSNNGGMTESASFKGCKQVHRRPSRQQHDFQSRRQLVREHGNYYRDMPIPIQHHVQQRRPLLRLSRPPEQAQHRTKEAQEEATVSVIYIQASYTCKEIENAETMNTPLEEGSWVWLYLSFKFSSASTKLYSQTSILTSLAPRTGCLSGRITEDLLTVDSKFPSWQNQRSRQMTGMQKCTRVAPHQLPIWED